jgi:hypothetical protein
MLDSYDSHIFLRGSITDAGPYAFEKLTRKSPATMIGGGAGA